jgi:hypothetical protein
MMLDSLTLIVQYSFCGTIYITLRRQAQKEIEGLRKEIHDGRNLRTVYEHLLQVRHEPSNIPCISHTSTHFHHCCEPIVLNHFTSIFQDHESLKLSLESSERIRKQQKELIYLLQRSQSVANLTTELAGSASLSQSTVTVETAAANRAW